MFMSSSSSPTTSKNIILIGRTGMGKSSLCNNLLGGSKHSPFKIGDGQISYTLQCENHYSTALNANIFDTPGFGNNVQDEFINDMFIRNLTRIMKNPNANSTGQIDAFLLPVRFNPYPQMFKSDLEHLKNLFGSIAFKSLIILPIIDSPNDNMDYLMESVSKMNEVVRVIKGGRKEGLTEDLFCLWDNIDPKPDQLETLAYKIAKVEPYTYSKYLEAEKEIKEIVDAKFKVQMTRNIARVKRNYKDEDKIVKQWISNVQAQSLLKRKDFEVNQGEEANEVLGCKENQQMLQLVNVMKNFKEMFSKEVLRKTDLCTKVEDSITEDKN